MTDELRQSYERVRKAQIREFESTRPRMAALLRELDALYLFGTLGFDAVLTSEYSVLVAVNEQCGERNAPEPPWRPATERERTASIVAATERWPELAVLLPPRPRGASDCASCSGRGEITFQAGSVLCLDCGALGWSKDVVA